MAHPLILAKQFFFQWLNGYAPSIHIATNSDGSIQVSSKVNSCAMATKFPPVSSNRRWQSGLSSRFRRRFNRTKKTPQQCNPATDDSFSQTASEDLYKANGPKTPVQVNDLQCIPSVVDTAVQAAVDSTDVACQTAPAVQPKKSVLTITKIASLSIPAKPVFHPAVINASQAFYQKHPSDLTREETEKFKFYLDYKRREGEPVETDIIYLPSSMRNCLHCGHPT